MKSCTYAHEYLSSHRCGVTELSLGSAAFSSALGHKRCSVRALLVHSWDRIVRVRGGCIIPLQTMRYHWVTATLMILEILWRQYTKIILTFSDVCCCCC